MIKNFSPPKTHQVINLYFIYNTTVLCLTSDGVKNMRPQKYANSDLLTTSSWRNWERIGTGKISWPSPQVLSPLGRGTLLTLEEMYPSLQGHRDARGTWNTRARCCPFPPLSHFPARLSTFIKSTQAETLLQPFISSQSFLCCVKLTLNTVVCFAVVNAFVVS